MMRHSTIAYAVLLLTASGCSCSSQAAPPATSTAQETSGKQVVAESPQDHAAPTSDSSSVQPPDGERPKLKSRWGRTLADQIDRVDGGISQERDLIRETLRKNDDTLDRAFSKLPGRIEAANNTHDGPRRIAIPAP